MSWARNSLDSAVPHLEIYNSMKRQYCRLASVKSTRISVEGVTRLGVHGAFYDGGGDGDGEVCLSAVDYHHHCRGRSAVPSVSKMSFVACDALSLSLMSKGYWLSWSSAFSHQDCPSKVQMMRGTRMTTSSFSTEDDWKEEVCPTMSRSLDSFSSMMIRKSSHRKRQVTVRRYLSQNYAGQTMILKENRRT